MALGGVADAATAVTTISCLYSEPHGLADFRGKSRGTMLRTKSERPPRGHRLQMFWDYAEANPLGENSGSWIGTNDYALPALERLLGVGSR